jgi:RNA polymerase sigma-70 factor (ECF subfamily)
MEGMQNTDTVWLVSECIAGNEEAVASLFRVYEVSVYRLALSIVDDPAEANEITQETFLAALRSLNKYQEKQSFKAWLYTIAVNHSRSHLRKRRAVEKLQATLTRIFRIDFDKQLSPEETVIQDEKEAALWKSLNQLDDRYRMVVVLRYFHELSVREISQILAVNEGTIHSRLHKARETLRMELEYLNQE